MKRAMKKENKLHIFPVVLVTAMLLLIVCWNEKNTFSIFKSNQEGISKAYVAAFIVDASSSDGYGSTLDLDCNGDIGYTVNYKFNVTNQENGKTSYVATKYGIEIILPEALPSGIEMKLDNVNVEVSDSQLTYVVSDIGILNPGSTNINTHTLTFVADPEIVRYDMSFSGIKLNIIAEQTD